MVHVKDATLISLMFVVVWLSCGDDFVVFSGN